jgi:hypothetical protein
MAYKTGFGFDDRTYWTFIQLVNNISEMTIFDWTLSTSDYTTPIHSWSQSHCYIAWGLTSQRTCPLSSSGRLLLSCIGVGITQWRFFFYQEPVSVGTR